MSAKSLFVLPILALAPASIADEISYVVTSAPIAAGGSGSVNAPQFDPSLGVLRSVRVSVLGTVSGSWGFENTSATPDGVGGYASGEYVGAFVPVQIPMSGMYPPNPAFLLDPAVALTAFDGTVDFAGTSGATLTFADQSGDGGPVQEADIYTEPQLPPYVGAGTFAVGLGPIAQFGPSVPSWIQSSVTISATARVTVRYFYDPLPTRICRSTPWAGCPCNNPGSFGNGCANSLGSLGGALDAFGVASISSDTLALHGANMTNSNALYFQGTTFGYVPSVYGDGVRCVTGAIVRLGAKTNSGGSSQYPQPGDPSISVRGGVTSPGQRHYQVIYRDGGSFCTASQFNATNGMAILWIP